VTRAPLVLLALSACNAPWRAQGFVESTSGEPIEGASVAAVCDDSDTIDQTVTTSTGRFEIAGSKGAKRALGCKIEVRKPGFHMKTLHMTDVCFRSGKTSNYDDPCSARDGHVKLAAE